MLRRSLSLLVASLVLLVVALPAVAQDDAEYVSVQNARFEWRGKQNQTAMFRWSATVENPSKRRNVEVQVTLVLVDEQGNVVASDSTTVTLDKESSADVEREGTLPYADAARVASYRVDVAGAV